MPNQTPGLTPRTQANPGPEDSSSPPAGSDTQADPGIPPFLSVVRGSPTDAELAALVTVIAARAAATAGGVPAPPPPPRSRWSDKSRLMRPSIMPGQDAWRGSALPR